jgi:hypothetical protein
MGAPLKGLVRPSSAGVRGCGFRKRREKSRPKLAGNSDASCAAFLMCVSMPDAIRSAAFLKSVSMLDATRTV